MDILNVYIDGNNLYRSAKELGFEIDYKKFRGWLRQKYNPSFVYLFKSYIKKAPDADVSTQGSFS